MPSAEWYTVADVRRLTGWDARRVQRTFARWRDRGFPLVRYEAGAQGSPRGLLVVLAAEYHAVMRGEITETPVAA